MKRTLNKATPSEIARLPSPPPRCPTCRQPVPAERHTLEELAARVAEVERRVGVVEAKKL